jgi:hypothetical protein
MCQAQNFLFVKLKSCHVSFDQLTFFVVYVEFQNMITFTYELHFQNKYTTRTSVASSSQWRWFCLNLRTLNFCPFQIHFGSHLPTETFWSSKRILTKHQVKDRPPQLSFLYQMCLVYLSHHDQLKKNMIIVTYC